MPPIDRNAIYMELHFVTFKPKLSHQNNTLLGSTHPTSPFNLFWVILMTLELTNATADNFEELEFDNNTGEV